VQNVKTMNYQEPKMKEQCYTWGPKPSWFEKKIQPTWHWKYN